MFKHLDRAIEMLNECDYGLPSSIYMRTLDVGMRACDQIKFGETHINRKNNGKCGQ